MQLTVSLGVIMIIAMMTLTSEKAGADQTKFGAELLCDSNANRAVIIFATVEDDEPFLTKIPDIPASIGADSSLLAPRSGSSCQFGDGREVRVKTSTDPIDSFGYCGVSPPDRFSLWIGRRKIWSREVYNTCQHGFTHRAVIVNGSQLFDCMVAETKEEREARPWWQLPRHVDCADVSARLTQSKIDLVEYPPMGPPMPPVGTVLVTDVTDRILCQALADLQTEQPKGYAYANVSPDLWPLDPPPPLGRGQALRPTMISHIDATDVLGYRFDFDNDGDDDYVEFVAGMDNLFYGNYIVLMPSADLRPADLRRAETPSQAKEAIKLRRSGGFRVYSGADTPYGRDYFVNFFPFRLDGEDYLWAYTLKSQENPVALLYQPGKNGYLDLVCSFWRVQENY